MKKTIAKPYCESELCVGGVRYKWMISAFVWHCLRRLHFFPFDEKNKAKKILSILTPPSNTKSTSPRYLIRGPRGAEIIQSLYLEVFHWTFGQIAIKRLTKNVLLGFCLFLPVFVGAQSVDSIYTLQYELETPARFFTTDQLQQCYLVTPDNEVVKHNNEGKVLFRFNNNRLGELAHVDVTDPFNLLLYYPEYLTVILLDRTLSQTGEYNLYDLDVVEVRSVGLANDHNIWIYDDVVFKVKKINRNGKTLAESNDLSMILGKSIQPNFIIERHNWVYVNDPEIGILQFDLFGQYVRTIELLNLDKFQIHDQELIYQQNEQLYAFHLESLRTKRIALPQNKTGKNKIQIQKDRMYIQEGELVSLFTY